MTALPALGGGGLAVAFPALVASSPYFLYVGAAACLWAALATAWSILAYAGQESLGQGPELLDDPAVRRTPLDMGREAPI